MSKNDITVLLVEDELTLAMIIKDTLEENGFTIHTASDGEEGLKMGLQGGYDLILLDIMLPKMNGFDVCERIRRKSQVPIIFVTAREEEKDRILGLETGGDDYVTKPFSFPELKARIKANIRRSSGEVVTGEKTDPDIITVGELTIDKAHYSVEKSGEPIEMSKKDYNLILFLAENLGQAFSREDLLEKIWGYDDYFGDIRTVDVTVNRIRKKIESDPAHPEYLMTKRGVGYYLCKR